MKTPPYLKKGSKVALVSTARKISPTEISQALELFNKEGFCVIYDQKIFSEFSQFAGNDEIRASVFQRFLNDTSIEAIICTRGGYGTVRIIDKINFTKFIEKPKWIVGFSDVTVLHSHINQNFNIETIHATMPININNYTMRYLSSIAVINTLKGQKLSYEIKTHKLNLKGEAEGEIVGGNLSVIYSLLGSKSQLNTDGKILFLEDLDEYLYHIDRMIVALDRAGMLKNLKGLIVGEMSDMKDNVIPFGKNAYEIIYEHVSKYKYPVCFGFPAGHGQLNLPLILGRTTYLEITKSITKIVQVS